MKKNQILELTEKITSGIASDEEIILFQRLMELFEPAEQEVKAVPESKLFSQGSEIQSKIEQRLWPNNSGRKIAWVKYALAASVILVFSTITYLWSEKDHLTQLPAVASSNLSEIRPGGNAAVLRLPDGKKIVLQDLANGKLGAAHAIKQNDLLRYEPTANQEIEYHELSTPIGGQFSLVLPDGTRVWLNAASSIRFPTAFRGTSRKVELSGEAYLEVAYHETMPFHVTINGTHIEVLGTRFNVNGYAEEGRTKTTLLEGRVEINSSASAEILSPGEESSTTPGGQIFVNKHADIESALAWKNGLFRFEGADIEIIARQLQRWYDIKFLTKGNFNSIHISGEVPRSLNISEIITVLEASGITITPNGRTLTATPKE